MKMKTKTEELQVIEPEKLQPELLVVAENSGLVVTEAQAIAIQFAPFMTTVNEYGQLISKIEKENPTEDDAKLARQYRLKLVENRGKRGLDTVHADLKSSLLVRGRLIDNLKNIVENSSKLSEIEAEAIEKHQERKEKERQDKLAESRAELLKPFGTDLTYLPLGTMTDESFAKILDNETLLFNTRKAEAEKAEQDRIAAEKKAEEERIAREKADAEAREAQRVENERLKAEAADRERELAKEREAAEKLRKENEAKLAKQKADAEAETARLNKIAEQKLAAERAEREKAEAELKAKRDAEAKIEADRLAALSAPDKEKINSLYKDIKELAIPEFATKEAQSIGTTVRTRLNDLLAEIKELSKNLK